MKRLIIVVFITFFNLIFCDKFLFSQTDTLKLIKIINKTTDFSNIYIHYSSIKSRNNSSETNLKKVWLTKKGEFLQKIRVQSVENGKNVTLIVNNKEKLFINHTSKRSDLASLKLMDNKTINNFLSQLLSKQLPSFINYLPKDNEYLKNALQYYSNPTNAKIQALNDTTINNYPCFVYKITDFDSNSGFLPDYTENTDGTNAQFFVDYYYFNKTDSTLIAQKTDYFYEIPENNHSLFKTIETFILDSKQNENSSIYAINSDTLLSLYINSYTRYDGKFFISELTPISEKKISLDGIKTTENQSLTDNYYEKFIFVFIDDDNEECWRNLITLKNQIKNIRENRTDIVAILNRAISVIYEDFFKENYIKTIVSEDFFYKFVTDTLPFYALIDNTGKIHDISNIMNKDVLKKYIKY